MSIETSANIVDTDDFLKQTVTNTGVTLGEFYYMTNLQHTSLVSVDDLDEYLEHHGIKGQKWGVRRFQTAAGRLTAAGKARVASLKNAAKTHSEKKKQKAIDDAVNSGDINKVSKMQKQMSPQEIRKAMERVQLNQQLSQLKTKQAMESIQRANDVIKQVADTSQSLKRVYDSLSPIYNDMQKKNAPAISKKQKEIDAYNDARDLKMQKEKAAIEKTKLDEAWARQEAAADAKAKRDAAATKSQRAYEKEKAEQQMVRDKDMEKYRSNLRISEETGKMAAKEAFEAQTHDSKMKRIMDEYGAKKSVDLDFERDKAIDAMMVKMNSRAAKDDANYKDAPWNNPEYWDDIERDSGGKKKKKK